MKWQVLKLAVVLAAIGSAFGGAFAQDAPKDAPKAKNPVFADFDVDGRINLNEIHSRKVAWSDGQCRSCHAASHGSSAVNQLLLSRNSVANPLGIEVAPLDGTLRAHLNIDEKSGLVLSSVPDGSEGAKGGLKPHDVVLNIDQHSVNDPGKFNELLGGLQGKKAYFGVLRQGKPLGVEVAVPQMPLAMAIDLGFERIAWSDDRYRIGVTLSEADDTLRSHLKLAAGEGLVVTDVVDGSPAAKMGVKLHDVLIELDGKRLTSVEAINSQIQEIKEKTVLLKLLRSGQEVTCQIAPKKSSEPAQAQAMAELILVDEQARHPAIVRWLNARAEVAPPAPDAAAQVAELKKQLAELGKIVEKLEAAIAPAALPAEEKKPEGSPEKK